MGPGTHSEHQDWAAGKSSNNEKKNRLMQILYGLTHTMSHCEARRITASFIRLRNNINEGLPWILTYINFQYFICGSIREKRLPSCAADFIGPAVGEHGTRSLILPWSVNGPVSIDDGSSWTATESLEGTTEELQEWQHASLDTTQKTLRGVKM